MSVQLSLLLLLALLASNLIAMTILQRVGTLLHPVARVQALDGLEMAYRSALDPATALVLPAMSSASHSFAIAAQADVAPFALRPEEQRMAHALRQQLGLAPSVPVRLQLERVTGADARQQVFSWAPLRLRGSVGLPDGRWLNAVQHPSGGYEWSRLLAYALPVSVIPVLLIAFLFIGYLLRPIRRLVHASERIAQGERVAPIPAVGPREARVLTQSFNRMQQSLARQMEGRTRMLAAMSHDFNTPITELRLQLELLPDPSLRQDMLESLRDLSDMVRHTLAFVRDEDPAEPSQTLTVGALMGELEKRYRLLGAPVVWHGGDGQTALRCQPLALKRALTNLIDNALRHAGSAEVTTCVHQGLELVVEVADRGPGIPLDLMEEVFEPFVRFDGAGHRGANADQGVGLGLSIARAAAQAHGGDLILRNREPGLCACLRVPLRATPML